MGAKPVNFADQHSNASSYGLRSKKDQQIWANASSFKLGLRSISKFCKTKIGLYFSLTLLPCTATVEKQTITDKNSWETQSYQSRQYDIVCGFNRCFVTAYSMWLQYDIVWYHNMI